MWGKALWQLVLEISQMLIGHQNNGIHTTLSCNECARYWASFFIFTVVKYCCWGTRRNRKTDSCSPERNASCTVVLHTDSAGFYFFFEKKNCINLIVFHLKFNLNQWLTLELCMHVIFHTFISNLLFYIGFIKYNSLMVPNHILC